MTAEWYPAATQVNIPIGNFGIGHDDRLAVCLHLENGSLASCISHFKSAASGVSAHFCIGKDGSLYQFVSLAHTAYAQGLHFDRTTGQWYTSRPDVGRRNVQPTWSRLTSGMNINRAVLSVENEGKPGEPLTAAMQATQTKLLRWIAEQTGLVYVVGSTLIGHYMLDNIDRDYCPGPAFDFPAIAVRANQPTEPDWPALWGRDDYAAVAGFGITSAWRNTYRTGTGLGAAISDELQAEGRVVRVFARGWITWSVAAGVTVGWWT